MLNKTDAISAEQYEIRDYDISSLKKDLWAHLMSSIGNALNMNFYSSSWGHSASKVLEGTHEYDDYLRDHSYYAIVNQPEYIEGQLQFDNRLKSLLGGERGSVCDGAGFELNDGMCTKENPNSVGIHGISDAIYYDVPLWEFSEDQINGKDKYFLGGLLADNSPFAKHYGDLINEQGELNSDIERLKNDNTILQNQVTKLTQTIEDSSVPVFPYVDWSRANKSKAWYKDINWSLIKFESLSGAELENLDWSKINYKEASTNDSFDTSFIDWGDISVAKEHLQAKVYEVVDWESFDFHSLSEQEKQHIDSAKVDYAKIFTQLKTQDNVEFDIDSLNWSFINGLDPYFKKKLYKNVAWNKVNFQAVESSAFDWSEVNIKKAMKSDQFTLDAVDIEELKESKAFKKLKNALKKSSADDLLAAASSETLQSIGYKNIAGRIGNNLIINGAETSSFSLIAKPLNYVRASAIASSMGGTLASIDDAGALIQLRLIMEDNELISQKINKTMADDRPLVWFNEKDGEGTFRKYTALDLQVFDQYVGIADDVLTGDSKLWFFIDHGQQASSNNDQSSQDNDFPSDPISGVDICNLCTPDNDFIEPNITDIDFIEPNVSDETSLVIDLSYLI